MDIISPFPKYNLLGVEPPPGLKPQDSYQCVWDYLEWDIFTRNTNEWNTFDVTWQYPDPMTMYHQFHGLDNHSNHHESQTPTDDTAPIPDLDRHLPQNSITATSGHQIAQMTAASELSSKTRSNRKGDSGSSKTTKKPHDSAVRRPRQNRSTVVAARSLTSHAHPLIDADEEDEDYTDVISPGIKASLTFKPKPRNEVALEKNRISARKCRKRKQAENTILTSKELEMEQKNTDLNQCVSELAEEVRCLKMMLLNHAECGSKLIQDYIKKEAEKFVQRTIRERACTPGLSSGSDSVAESFASLRSP